MLAFIKGFFYLSASIAIILACFFTINYFEKQTEKQARMDEYYKKEYTEIYLWMPLSERFEMLEDLKKNAIDDGYSKADIEIMHERAVKEFMERKKN